MKRILTALAIASFLLTTVAPALAQEQTQTQSQGPTMTVGPDVLTQGNAATIHYSDPSKAGKKVTVTVDNGMRRNTIVETIEITLDANGNGSAEWLVPNWYGANFNAPGVSEINCPIH